MGVGYRGGWVPVSVGVPCIPEHIVECHILPDRVACVHAQIPSKV